MKHTQLKIWWRQREIWNRRFFTDQAQKRSPQVFGGSPMAQTPEASLTAAFGDKPRWTRWLPHPAGCLRPLWSLWSALEVCWWGTDTISCDPEPEHSRRWCPADQCGCQCRSELGPSQTIYDEISYHVLLRVCVTLQTLPTCESSSQGFALLLSLTVSEGILKLP